MKLTGRLLIAFALTQFVVVLCALTLDEGLGVHLWWGNWSVVLDLGALALLWAGSAVSKGSRPGRMVAALLSLFYVLSAAVVVTTTALSGIGQAPISRLAVVLVMGAWSGTNLVLLIRYCDLKSCVPRYSLRTLLILVLLVAIALKGFCWLREIGKPPPFASVAAIEQRYDEQLSYLRKAALAGPLPAIPTSINDPINLKLFGPKEILAAGIGPISDTHGHRVFSTVLANSTPWKHRSTIGMHRKAGVEQPVVMLWNQEDADGQRRKVAIYANRVIDPNGRQVEYFIEFDLNQLRDTDLTATDAISPPTR
jgi:hypothetical protein